MLTQYALEFSLINGLRLDSIGLQIRNKRIDAGKIYEELSNYSREFFHFINSFNQHYFIIFRCIAGFIRNLDSSEVYHAAC